MNEHGDESNSSGFSAVLGGAREFDGRFGSLSRVIIEMDETGIWWTSTSAYKYAAVYWNMVADGDIVNRNIYSKLAGFSVRCMKDLPDEKDLNK